ncbi:hypothetical protein [Anianabacter salinae]|uniref:hypothetical protein n=1 Tax=Anianabacter salinae TaxID=2851023 RepID=UPI00225E0CF1|nr:hypothetical protein [Anianabacter salinae]MBV0912977.1 hypothetical protein [Anianabacter salinae]
MPHPDSLSVHANPVEGTGFRKLPQSGTGPLPHTEEDEVRTLEVARVVLFTSAIASMIGIVCYVILG